MHLTPAETELIELIRRGNAQTFTLTISVANGQWAVMTEAPGGYAAGRDESFEAAWFGRTVDDVK